MRYRYVILDYEAIPIGSTHGDPLWVTKDGKLVSVEDESVEGETVGWEELLECAIK